MKPQMKFTKEDLLSFADDIVTFKDGTSKRFGAMTAEEHRRKADELRELEARFEREVIGN